MGLFKIIYLATQLLPNTEREIRMLEAEWAKSEKKFRKHVDSCKVLQTWPLEWCDECAKVAAKTGKTGWLMTIREQITRLNTPTILEEYSEKDIIAAAKEEWERDPTRPAAIAGYIGDRYHNSVTVSMHDPAGGRGPGSVRVERQGGRLVCDVYVFKQEDLDRAMGLMK